MAILAMTITGQDARRATPRVRLRASGAGTDKGFRQPAEYILRGYFGAGVATSF